MTRVAGLLILSLIAFPLCQLPVAAAAPATTFVLVIPSGAHFNDSAEGLAKGLRDMFPRDAGSRAGRSRIGVVFVGSEDDEEKIDFLPPVSPADVAEVLHRVSLRSANDAEERPLLDGVYVGGLLFDWQDGGADQRVVVTLLDEDAAPGTSGGIDDRVPRGLDARAVTALLLDRGIKVVAAQTGRWSEERTAEIMQTLGPGTGGRFLPLRDGATPEQAGRSVAALMAALAARGNDGWGEPQ